MSRETIEIVIIERGSAAAAGNIASIGRSAATAEGSISLLNRALGAIAASFSISEVIKLSDAYQNMQNRLKLVTSSSDELRAVTESLFDISTQTRASFEETVNTYARVRTSIQNLGLSQKETLEFTRGLNEAILLSGTTAAEAKFGLIQFTQALAANRLSGQELNSVLKEIPKVADVIAASLGKNRGDLKALGKEGKLTAEVIIKAFKEALPELDKLALDRIPTIGQAFQVLENQFLRVIGEFNERNGTLKLFSGLILEIADHIDVLARGLAAIAIIVGAGIFAAVTTQLQRLAITAFANPFGALSFGIVAATAALITFGDQLRINQTDITTFRDFAGATADYIRNKFGDDFSVIVTTVGSAFAEMGVTPEILLRACAFAADKIVGIFAAMSVTIITLFQNIGPAVKDTLISAANAAGAVYVSTLNSIINGLNSAPSFLRGGHVFQPVNFVPIANDAENTVKTVTEIITDAWSDGMNGTDFQDGLTNILTNAQDNAVKRSAAELKQRISNDLAKLFLDNPDLFGGRGTPHPGTPAATKNKFSFAEALKELQLQNAAMRDQNGLLVINAQQLDIQNKLYEIRKKLTHDFTDLSKDLTATQRDQILAQLQKNELDKAEVKIAQELNGAQIERANGQAAITAALKDGLITQEQATFKMQEFAIAAANAEHTLRGGFTAGLLEVQHSFTDFSKIASETVQKTFSDISDAFVKLATTGKFSFKDLINSILADITRMTTQISITGPLAQWLGANSGQGGGFLSSLFSQNFSGAGSGIGGWFSGLFDGHKTGADFEVGGVGGPDSQFVGFRASPKERVTITPPGQSGPGSKRMIQQNFYISTPDADSFRKSMGQILAQGSAAATRADRRNN